MCWSTKAAISLKCEDKLLWRPIRTHQCSFERYHPQPCDLLFPRLGVCNPHPKLHYKILGKRVLIEQCNLPIGTHQRSFGQYRFRPLCPKICWLPPIISGMGKATDFKFGRYIHRVHPNKIALRILGKRERGCIQGLPIFFGYPYYLGNAQVKLRTSDFVRTFIGSIGTKVHLKFGEKLLWA